MVKMAERNLNKTTRLVLVSFAVVVCLALPVACLGPSASVKGTILRASGEAFAGRDVVLIPVRAGDKVRVFAIRAGGAMEVQVPLDELGEMLNPSDYIMFETGGGGAARWKTETSDTGESSGIEVATPDETPEEEADETSPPTEKPETEASGAEEE